MEINTALIQPNMQQVDNNPASQAGPRRDISIQKELTNQQDISTRQGKELIEQNRRLNKIREQDNKDDIEPLKRELFELKAVFALDKEKNVVIRFLDKKGEIVRQIPPEEYINMVKKFKANVESLFSKEV